MRICVTGLRGLPNVMGGVESHCEELLPRILSLDPDVQIQVVGRKPYLQNKSPYSFRGVEVAPLPSPRQTSLEAIASTFLGVLHARRGGWRLVHIHAIGPALMTPLARLLGLRTVMTHHGADYDRAKWSLAAKAALHLGEWAGMRFAHQIIVVSPSLAEALKRKFPFAANRIRYIPNGASDLQTAAPADGSALEQLGLVPGGYILAVGRLVPEKGFDLLIEAYRKSGINKPLIIAGGADHDSDYSRELQMLGDERIRFVGRLPRSALKELYQNTWLFVLPSYHEGLPIAALEAANCGAPVLLSDIPANLDIGLEPSSYFRSGDVNALAEALVKPAGSFTVDAPALRKRFDWEKIAQQTLTVYREAY
jgi:glycosyltransferase involved in cell wall biosynthesis